MKRGATPAAPRALSCNVTRPHCTRCAATRRARACGARHAHPHPHPQLTIPPRQQLTMCCNQWNIRDSRPARSSADADPGACTGLTSDTPRDGAPDRAVTAVAVDQPGFCVCHLVEHGFLEVALVAAQQQVHVEGDLEDGPGAAPLRVVDVSEATGHAVA